MATGCVTREGDEVILLRPEVDYSENFQVRLRTDSGEVTVNCVREDAAACIDLVGSAGLTRFRCRDNNPKCDSIRQICCSSGEFAVV